MSYSLAASIQITPNTPLYPHDIDERLILRVVTIHDMQNIDPDKVWREFTFITHISNPGAIANSPYNHVVVALPGSRLQIFFAMHLA